MLVLSFVFGALCGSFITIILMAMLFMAKEADKDAQALNECLGEKLALRKTARAA